jgi:hypothetical protein
LGSLGIEVKEDSRFSVHNNHKLLDHFVSSRIANDSDSTSTKPIPRLKSGPHDVITISTIDFKRKWLAHYKGFDNNASFEAVHASQQLKKRTGGNFAATSYREEEEENSNSNDSSSNSGHNSDKSNGSDSGSGSDSDKDTAVTAKCAQLSSTPSASLVTITKDPSLPSINVVEARDPIIASSIKNTTDEYHNLRGIVNITNSCFMSSVLQCLINCSPVTEVLQDKQLVTSEFQRYDICIAVFIK